MTKSTNLPAFSSTFLQNFCQHRPPEPSNKQRGRGRPPQLPATDIVAALAWHVMQPTATFAHNLAALTGLKLSDSTLSERRQALGIKPWVEALDTMLRAVAQPTVHPEAFYKGLRLVGVDGTTFCVANTPTVKRSTDKAKTRRGNAAFHRVSCVALAELGTHTPVNVQIAQNDESEAALAAQIISRLHEDDLLVADRYYGSGKWVARFRALPTKPHYLLRVQEAFKSHQVRRLPDGSCIVTVRDPDTNQNMTLREIKGSVGRKGRRWVKVRFWTSLLDHTKYPAYQLLRLYGMRWEQEIAFRELKYYLQDDNLLLSHTTVTAVQEICSLFMAQAIVARMRSQTAANHNTAILRISFGKTLLACRNFGWLISIAGNILTKKQLQEIATAIEWQLYQQQSNARRQRSCPRLVRQPIKKWHRLMENEYEIGDFVFKLRKS